MTKKFIGNSKGKPKGKNNYKFSAASRAQMSIAMKKRWEKQRGFERMGIDKQAHDDFIAWMLAQGTPDESEGQ